MFMYNKEYYEQNKEKFKESQKKWSERNPDKVKDYRKLYYNRVHSSPEYIKQKLENYFVKLKTRKINQYQNEIEKCKIRKENYEKKLNDINQKIYYLENVLKDMME